MCISYIKDLHCSKLNHWMPRSLPLPRFLSRTNETPYHFPIHSPMWNHPQGMFYVRRHRRSETLEVNARTDTPTKPMTYL